MPIIGWAVVRLKSVAKIEPSWRDIIYELLYEYTQHLAMVVVKVSGNRLGTMEECAHIYDSLTLSLARRVWTGTH